MHFCTAQQSLLAPPTQSHTAWGRANEPLGIPFIMAIEFQQLDRKPAHSEINQLPANNGPGFCRWGPRRY